MALGGQKMGRPHVFFVLFFKCCIRTVFVQMLEMPFWSLSKCKCDENMFWCQNEHKTYSIVLMYIDFCGATYTRLQWWDRWAVEKSPKVQTNENAGCLIRILYSERKLITVNSMQLKLWILNNSLISTACSISKCGKIDLRGPLYCTCIPHLHLWSSHNILDSFFNEICLLWI